MYVTPLLFVMPLRSIFESCLLLMAELAAGAIPAARQAVLHTVVTGAPHVDEIQRKNQGGAASCAHRMPHTPLEAFDEHRLAVSEGILGHRCNEDQAAAVRRLQTGLMAIHGPPGTGAALFSLVFATWLFSALVRSVFSRACPRRALGQRAWSHIAHAHCMNKAHSRDTRLAEAVGRAAT